jgi:1,4-dihydroxy-2-naphthoate octaprenyltransferase
MAESKSAARALLGPMRPPFLIAAFASVLLGGSAALWTHGRIDPFYFVLALIGGISAHMSVNVLNEYFDFRSGLDYHTQPTPYSGGSGTLVSRPELAPYALAIGLGGVAVVALIGIYFLTVFGWALLPLGLIGIILILAYTPYITHMPFISLLAPGAGIGLGMVNGTNFVLTGEYTWTAFFASLVPGFLISNLLVINQFPDVEPDTAAGRRNYVIVLGRKRASLIFIAMYAGMYLSIILGVALGYLPLTGLIALLTLILAVPTAIAAYRYADDMENLLPYLGRNIQVSIITPILLAIGLLIAPG